MYDQPIPMTQTIPAAQVRQNFSEIVSRVFKRQARVVVERNGLAIVAIISAADLERLNRYDEAERARLSLVGEVRNVLGAVGSPRGREVESQGIAALRRMREAFKNVPEEEIEQAVSEAVGEVRDDLRTGTSATTTP